MESIIILQRNAVISNEELSIELSRFHEMINKGVLLIDARYKEPIIIDRSSKQVYCVKCADND